MENVPSLLKSRRFWVSVLGTLVIIISAFEPHLAARFDEIVPAVLAIVGVLVGGYSLEDAVATHADGKIAAAKVDAQAAFNKPASVRLSEQQHSVN